MDTAEQIRGMLGQKVWAVVSQSLAWLAVLK